MYESLEIDGDSVHSLYKDVMQAAAKSLQATAYRLRQAETF